MDKGSTSCSGNMSQFNNCSKFIKTNCIEISSKQYIMELGNLNGVFV